MKKTHHELIFSRKLIDLITTRIKPHVFLTGLLFAVLIGCGTAKPITEGNFRESDISADEVTSSIPNYTEQLTSVAGKGRALVSEPNNSDRATINFQANQELSVLTIQNRIGIEGGQMLVDQDSILIYNRIDKVAQKISIYDGRMTSLNELASINILDLLNFKVSSEQVQNVLESNNSLQLRLVNGAKVYIDRENRRVEQVVQPRRTRAPYSKIMYESYGTLEGFVLPRKITIFSADKDSRVVFLIRNLDVNPTDLKLHIDIPADVKIQRL